MGRKKRNRSKSKVNKETESIQELQNESSELNSTILQPGKQVDLVQILNSEQKVQKVDQENNDNQACNAEVQNQAEEVISNTQQTKNKRKRQKSKDPQQEGEIQDENQQERFLVQKYPLNKLMTIGFQKFMSIFTKIAILPLRIKKNTEDQSQEIEQKYWAQRYSLFSKFDEGIKLDKESWFSCTHEKIAEWIAQQCSQFNTIIDVCCGIGGNSIQFAKYCKNVIAIDVDQQKIEYAKHNAQIYGVGQNIQFICGDLLEELPKLSGDCVFVSPPWGGPDYLQNPKYDLESYITIQSKLLEQNQSIIQQIIKAAKKVTQNIWLYLPRNIDPCQMNQIWKDIVDWNAYSEFQLFCYGNKIKNIAVVIRNLESVSQEQFSQLLANRLQESKKPQQKLIQNIVSRLGISYCYEKLNETMEIVKNGGMKLQQNQGNRTKGGTFFQLIRQSGKIDWKELNQKNKNKKKQKVQDTTYNSIDQLNSQANCQKQNESQNEPCEEEKNNNEENEKNEKNEKNEENGKSLNDKE